MTAIAALPAMDVAGRAVRTRRAFDDAGIDALLVTSLTNIRYLTGFTGSAGLLLVTADEAVLATDGRYGEQAEEQISHAGAAVRVEVGLTSDAQRVVVTRASAGISRLGLEADHVTWAQKRRFGAEWFASAELVPCEGLIERLRAVKDEGEIARIEAAAGIADRALASLRPLLDVGTSEAEFGLELDTTMRRFGASGPSFETIVASGPNGARPHARPSDRRLADGDLVVVDFGATVDGYRSDMTRTFAVGSITEVQQEMVSLVRTAQAEGVAAVQAGARAREVDEACRRVIRQAGWGERFVHGTGHGVGLDIHEDPRVSAASDATLAPGHVVTVEPGVYIPEHGGVRIEDTLVVTEDGARALTRAPKD